MNDDQDDPRQDRDEYDLAHGCEICQLRRCCCDPQDLEPEDDGCRVIDKPEPTPVTP